MAGDLWSQHRGKDGPAAHPVGHVAYSHSSESLRRPLSALAPDALPFLWTPTCLSGARTRRSWDLKPVLSDQVSVSSGLPWQNHGPEAEVRTQVSAQPGSGEGPPGLQMASFSPCPHMAETERWGLFLEGH